MIGVNVHLPTSDDDEPSEIKSKSERVTARLCMKLCDMRMI